ADRGEGFGEPIAVAFEEAHRCYDSCLWIDPIGRLWFAWSYAPEHAVYAAICNDPDANEIIWSKERIIGKDVMLNKPTVLSTGEWLFPMAVWNYGVRAIESKYDTADNDKGSFVYKTIDNGLTFEKFGKAEVKDRSYDEHMILEFKDGSLGMFVRTKYGIGVSYSYDKGKSWTEGRDSGLGGPCSRFFIRRLKSGRILLINHCNFKGRNNLTAMLSEDECKTWKYKLLLDERDNVSYPDAFECEDGYIYITYDRERGAFLKSLDEVYSSAREILIAKITENDIINGSISDSGSYIKKAASKLSKYALESENPYNETDRFSDKELACQLSAKTTDEIISCIFDRYKINCMNLHKIDSKKLDMLLDELKKGTSDKEKVLFEIIALVRSVTCLEKSEIPIIDRIKDIIKENLSSGLSVEELANLLGISKYYMCHLFKKATGITIKNYEKAARISKAKEYLINSDKPITEIAHKCGYENSCYFSEMFITSEKVSPSQYRKLLKNSQGHDRDVIYYSMLRHIDLTDELEISNLSEIGKIKSYAVTMPSEKYAFLHESAIIKYHNVLFAAWYNNKKNELFGETPIRFSYSCDEGQSWSSPKVVVSDESEKILYCPPVFGICDDKLYMLLNQMVAPDHIHSLDLYEYNEIEKTFKFIWSKPIPFKLNTNVYTLANGKLILPGRIGEIDKFPNTPAVLISDSGKIDDEWRLVKIQKDGNLADGSKFVHPEVSLITLKDKIYAFCRNDERKVPVIYVSNDFGETWSEPFSHNIPFSASKTYSGTLSDGRNYVIGNLSPDRSKLVLFLSEQKTMRFTREFIIQDGFSNDLGFGLRWHYPSAYEKDGKLYIIYTVDTEKNKRGAVVSVIEISEI
ncbi:MAG: exo-alpha-sialidase, partial [Eubacteriales bacterium]